MPKVFSRRTLGKFEDASASLVLRQIDRAFEGADFRPGADPGGHAGERRSLFRRYIAGIDQSDPEQLERLGDALGALIENVDPEKNEPLIKAAERDGFSLTDGVFRRGGATPSCFMVTHAQDLAFIENRATQLHLLANDSPKDAIGGAKELVESTCRTILRLVGEPAPAKTADLVDLAKSTLKALELVPADIDDAKRGADLVRRCLQQLGAVVGSLGELRNLYGSGHGRDGKWKGLSPRHARLAVGAAVTFTGFIADTYADRVPLKNG